MRIEFFISEQLSRVSGSNPPLSSFQLDRHILNLPLKHQAFLPNDLAVPP